MTAPKLILSIDQGTTSSRAILFNRVGTEVSVASRLVPIQYPRDGWVEQNANDIWNSVQSVVAEILADARGDIVACGLTNQRETVLAWDRATGEPLTPAIVWQCRRTLPMIEKLRGSGVETLLQQKTGLVLDPYFSASKINWLIVNTPGLLEKLESGAAVVGTIDSYILFRLTQGRSCLTDPSNASRTMLCTLGEADWDLELLSMFGIPKAGLPNIQPSASDFGAITAFSGWSIPIRAVLGDQQASLFGHGCWDEHDAKCTFGTGAFLLKNTGRERVDSPHRLLSTLAWDIPFSGFGKFYALEGSVFVAGSAVQWLRDGLGILEHSAQSDEVARGVSGSDGVVVVPAFVGLGAPRWNSRARGTIHGITRATTRAHIVRAALEGIAHSVADLFDSDEFRSVRCLSIDGGMSRNTLFCQTLADILGRDIVLAKHSETTASGVAALAALAVGMASPDDILRNFCARSQSDSCVVPGWTGKQRADARHRWRSAVSACELFADACDDRGSN